MKRGSVGFVMLWLPLITSGEASASTCLTTGLALEQDDPAAAAAAFEAALSDPACATEEMQLFLRYSQGRALLAAAKGDPSSACRAQDVLRPLSEVDDEAVSTGARGMLTDAERACRAALAAWPGEPVGPGAHGASAAPEVDGPPAATVTAPEPPPAAPRDPEPPSGEAPDPPDGRATADVGPAVEPSFALGISVGGGLGRLGGFTHESVETRAGPAARAALMVEYRAGDALWLRVEPGVLWQGLAFDAGERGTGRWDFWSLGLPVLVRYALPLGLDVTAGVAGGLYLSAVERRGSDARSIADSVRAWSLDGLLGLGHGWQLDPTRVRVELRAEHGLVGLSAESDAPIMPQRVSLAVDVAF